MRNCDHFTYTYVGWFYGQCVGEQRNEKLPQKSSHYEQFIHMSANIVDRVDKHPNKGLV